MRGHIVQRSKRKGTYSVKISLGRDPVTGKYKSKWLTAPSSKEAEKLRTEALYQRDTGTIMQPGKVIVGQFLNRWLTDYVKANLTPKGFERYESITRRHLIPAFGSLQLQKLQSSHVQKHYADMLASGLAPRSVKYEHVVLHKALVTAIKWGLVQRNVCDGIDIPKAQRHEMVVWNEDEINKFLEVAKGSVYYALFYAALFTGARRGELLALRWADIDFVYGQISINRSLHVLKGREFIYTAPKTDKSRRQIAMPPSLFLVLESYKKAKEIEAKMMDKTLTDDDLVFNSLGQPWRPTSISRAFENMAAKAGVKVIRFHDMRHSHASLMLKQGIHPKIVQERLGHSTISVTLDTYSHVAPGLQEAAAKSFDSIIQNKREEVAK